MDALNHEVLHLQQTEIRVRCPAEAVQHFPMLWARFHRGSTMTIVARRERSAEVAFAHPPLLFPGAWMESRRRTLVGVLVRAGAVQPEVRATPDGAQGTRFAMYWT